MQLTSFTDYSLRVLLFLGAQPENKLSSIKEISEVYGISNNHLKKIVFELGKLGFIDTIRGRYGGIKLGKTPESINIGSVVRQTEVLDIAECFDPESNRCIIQPGCRLKNILNEALQAYLQVLDKYTLADLLINKDHLQTLLQPMRN